MKRYLQIFGPILLAAFLLIAGLIRFDSGRPGHSAVHTAIEKTEETAVNLGSYYEMARLSMREPDEQLIMPVKGVKTKQIADTWGADRGEGRRHNGQDIFAKRGTPVYSATEGYVLHVGENSLGGKVVFVYGAGGRRYYYAHLDDFAPELKAGDYVSTGSLLGFVGSTGNARNTPPHLHFGVYGNGGAINPLPFLTDRT